MMQYRTIVTMEGEYRKPHPSFRMVPFSMTLSDPNLDFKLRILFNDK